MTNRPVVPAVRYAAVMIGAALFTFAPMARACLWEIKITSEGYSGAGEGLGLQTMRFYFDPASLDVSCSGPGDHVTCISGPGISTYGIRTQIGETIIHNSFLEPWFLVQPYDHSEDGGAYIAGFAGNWTWTNPEFMGQTIVGNITVSHIPEPGTLALLSLGLFGLSMSRRHKAN